MSRNLALSKPLSITSRILLPPKLQTLHPQFTNHDSNNHTSTQNSTSNPENFYTSLLARSTCKNHLNQIHSQIIITGFQSNGFIITKLIHVASNFGEITYARQVFDKMPEPHVFLYNAIIRAYSKENMFPEAITMYTQMQNTGVGPDSFTFPHILKACGGASALEVGRAVHGQIFRRGFEGDGFVQNGLVAVYAKCGRIHNARAVFDLLGDMNRTVVSWTSVISAYAQNGYPIEALKFYKKMRGCGLNPDWITFVSVISAYADVDDVGQGECLHSSVMKMGLTLEPDLRIALVTLYTKCGYLKVAKVLFEEVETRNVIMWNAMISGYVKNGYSDEAIILFKKMLEKDLKPDSVTVCSTVLACAQVGSIEEARKMGAYVSKSACYKTDVYVNTALIDMYAKCGSVELAREVFNQTEKETKDVVVWSAMIVGYGLHGKAREAINLFNQMKEVGVCPNDVTFIGLLTACNHAGLVEHGWLVFNAMKEYKVEPRHQHYACVVDLLGRAGRLDRAYDFIKGMPVEPGVSVWGALLSASRIYRDVGLGEYAAERLFELDAYNTGHYVQLSNLYASVRMWSGVARVRVLMKERGLSKDMGCSVIEVDGMVHVFRMGDMSHPRCGEIFKEHRRLEVRLKEAGLVADTECGLHDLSCEDMEESIGIHSERLAIVYGLMCTEAGSTIRVTKNLRACVNCHAAIKLISKVENRVIVVRDANRFHHFKDGECSCGDYW